MLQGPSADQVLIGFFQNSFPPVLGTSAAAFQVASVEKADLVHAQALRGRVGPGGAGIPRLSALKVMR